METETEKRATKTPSSSRRRVRFAKEAETSINIDASSEGVLDGEDDLEARSSSIIAKLSK